MISAQLEILLNKAIRKANTLKHEFLTLENVLLALLSDEKIADILKSCNGNLTQLEADLNDFIENSDNFSILNQEEIDEISKDQFDNEEVKKNAKTARNFQTPLISNYH